jgi:hypothetical protein
MTMIKRSLTLLTFLVLAALAGSGSVAARGGNDNRVERAGGCSGNSNWKLKAKPDDGRIEAEFEVDQNRTGVRWHVVLRHNGSKVLDTHRRTQAPSGSFTVHARPNDAAGSDKISAVATRRSGETCRASLRI